MKLLTDIKDRWFRSRKPMSIASDVLFILLVIMLIIPSTRRVVLSGVATVRTWISNPDQSGKDNRQLDVGSWDWELADLQGHTISFASLKGEIVFLNQWATWCPPCRAEMPAIERLYKEYGSKVRFVILSGEDPGKVGEFMDKQGYTFPVYLGQVSGTALATRSIPSTVIIDRDGRIVVKRNGAFNWNARKIRKLLDRL